MLSGVGLSVVTAIPASQAGQPNGVATLDSSGDVPIAQIPTGIIPHVGYTSGDYALTWAVSSYISRTPSTAAAVTAWPFFTPSPMTVNQIGVNLLTAQVGAACRVGLYTNTTGGRPGTLIVDGGELDLSVAAPADVVTGAISGAVTGNFWLLIWMKNVATQASVAGPNARSSGNLPQPSTGLSNLSPACMYFLAAAYPGAMPASAPAVVPSVATSVPSGIIRFA